MTSVKKKRTISSAQKPKHRNPKRSKVGAARKKDKRSAGRIARRVALGGSVLLGAGLLRSYLTSPDNKRTGARNHAQNKRNAVTGPDLTPAPSPELTQLVVSSSQTVDTNPATPIIAPMVANAIHQQPELMQQLAGSYTIALQDPSQLNAFHAACRRIAHVMMQDPAVREAFTRTQGIELSSVVGTVRVSDTAVREASSLLRWLLISVLVITSVVYFEILRKPGMAASEAVVEIVAFLRTCVAKTHGCVQFLTSWMPG